MVKKVIYGRRPAPIAKSGAGFVSFSRSSMAGKVI
jgi:hypothetical protein